MVTKSSPAVIFMLVLLCTGLANCDSESTEQVRDYPLFATDHERVEGAWRFIGVREFSNGKLIDISMLGGYTIGEVISFKKGIYSVFSSKGELIFLGQYEWGSGHLANVVTVELMIASLPRSQSEFQSRFILVPECKDGRFNLELIPVFQRWDRAMAFVFERVE